jgi:hypothetical protein
MAASTEDAAGSASSIRVNVFLICEVATADNKIECLKQEWVNELRVTLGNVARVIPIERHAQTRSTVHPNSGCACTSSPPPRPARTLRWPPTRAHTQPKKGRKDSPGGYRLVLSRLERRTYFSTRAHFVNLFCCASLSLFLLLFCSLSLRSFRHSLAKSHDT